MKQLQSILRARIAAAFPFAALLVAFGVGSALAAPVEVLGVAAVVNDNVVQARDRAIDDAKRKAVEQVAGSQVSAQSIMKNFQLVEDRIYARASGFVKSYRIVDERREGNVYNVRISAEVDGRSLAADLGLIMKVRPRVIIMIAEQNVGRDGFSYWWGSKGLVSDMDILQNALIEAWHPRGFKFVDPSLLSDTLSVKGALQSPALSNASALSIGRDADADIAIVGKVLVTDGGQVMKGVDMRSFNAVGTLRVLNVDTGEIVAVADRTSTASHVDPNLGGRAAIKSLAEMIGDELETKILKRWTAESASARELELVIDGVRNDRDAQAVEKVIREQIRGVESVHVRRRRQRRAYFAVRVRASAVEFGRDLESKTYPRFSLETVSVSRSKLTAKVTK